MKIISLIAVIIFYSIYCTSIHEEALPIEIQKKKKEIQYKSAKFEMYKLLTSGTCNCRAINTINRDTGLSTSLDIKLDRIETFGDTCYYYFSYFKKNGNEEMRYLLELGKFRYCFDYWGVGFLGDSETPFRFFAGDGIGNYEEGRHRKFSEALCDCVKENPNHANKWLLEYINSHKICKD